MTRHIVKSSEPQEPVTEWSLLNVGDCLKLWAGVPHGSRKIAVLTIRRDGTLERTSHSDDAERRAHLDKLGIRLDSSGRIAMEE